jgi:hypothetical protein
MLAKTKNIDAWLLRRNFWLHLLVTKGGKRIASSEIENLDYSARGYLKFSLVEYSDPLLSSPVLRGRERVYNVWREWGKYLFIKTLALLKG